VLRQAPWVEFRSTPRGRTSNPECSLLCKTDYPSAVTINGEPVKQYKTGIFFRQLSLAEGRNRIVLTLFGVGSSSTWITHNTGRKVIDTVTWQQTTPETYQVYINLKTNKIWGYDLRVDGKLLLLSVKYPPVYNLNNKKPLTGLKLAIEAGHGGILTGAIGLSGLVEKDINLDLALMLGDLLKAEGAEVIQLLRFSGVSWPGRYMKVSATILPI
jgi:N-acetylmuramoyl-L-alanine amidase